MNSFDEKLTKELIENISNFAVSQYGYIKSYQKENETVYNQCDFRDALITLWLKHSTNKTIIRYVLNPLWTLDIETE